MGSLSYQASLVQPSKVIDGTARSIELYVQCSVTGPGLPNPAIHGIAETHLQLNDHRGAFPNSEVLAITF